MAHSLWTRRPGERLPGQSPHTLAITQGNWKFDQKKPSQCDEHTLLCLEGTLSLVDHNIWGSD